MPTSRSTQAWVCPTSPATWPRGLPHLPGHSPGSIALYDRAQDTLYSGDGVSDGELIDNALGCAPEDDATSMERLARLGPGLVHPGHCHAFDTQRMQAPNTDYLAGRRASGCPALE